MMFTSLRKPRKLAASLS